MIEINEMDNAGVMQITDTARMPDDRSLGFIVKTKTGKWLAIPNYCEAFDLRRDAIDFLNTE